jgi:ribosomal protein L7Ae-like RNA K-turn-binding protein
VVGLREAKKFLSVKKMKLVILAPDLENAKGKGELSGSLAR